VSRCTVTVCDWCDMIIWPDEASKTYPLAMLQSIDVHVSCSEKSEKAGFNTANARIARNRSDVNIKRSKR
jgi:hypothetical protein